MPNNKSRLARPVTDAQMRANPSEYGGNAGRQNRGRATDEVDIAGSAAAERSRMTRDDERF